MSEEEEKNSAATKIENEDVKRWNKAFWLLIFVPIILGISIKVVLTNLETYEYDNGVTISENVISVFDSFDTDRNGFLSLDEFQHAYFAVKAGIDDSISPELNETVVKAKHFFEDVKDVLSTQELNSSEEMIYLEAHLTSLNLSTMNKFKDDRFESETKFHLRGLMSWTKPHIRKANFSVSNFSVFLPANENQLTVGNLWNLIPKRMSHDGEHLPTPRYFPPAPQNEVERFLFFLLSMFHERPFLHMRFPPTGGMAGVRAVGKYHYDIWFRLHPEFQLNDVNHFPFWFTPAALVGNMVIRKDGSHIESFSMHVPNHLKLNVDMEWMTTLKATKDNGEVDIGYMQEMSLSSIYPSSLSKDFDITRRPSVIPWTEGISEGDMFKILEKDFYPFKEVPYYPFNETFEKAKEENKLVHHILLWGSLDDQSC